MKHNIIFLLFFTFCFVGISGCTFYHDVPPSIPEENLGVYAYLNATSVTTCVLADTWYPVEGIFINEPVKGFYVNVSIPAIVYNRTFNTTMEVQTHSSLSADLPGVTVSGAVAINGVVNPQVSSSIFMRNLNEIYSVSGNGVTDFSQNDTIQLVIKCDTAGADITTYQLTTSIRRFF